MPENMSNQAPDSVAEANQLQFMNVPHEMRGVSTVEHESARNSSTSDKYPSYVDTDSPIAPIVPLVNSTTTSNIHTMENIRREPVKDLTEAMSTSYPDNAYSTQTPRVTVPIKTDLV